MSMSIESPTPAVSLENQLNRLHSDPQNTLNVLDNPNTSGASGASPTANVDISFIRVKADCKPSWLFSLFYRFYLLNVY